MLAAAAAAATAIEHVPKCTLCGLALANQTPWPHWLHA
jgi:hypothetical protein